MLDHVLRVAPGCDQIVVERNRGQHAMDSAKMESRQDLRVHPASDNHGRHGEDHRPKHWRERLRLELFRPLDELRSFRVIDDKFLQVLTEYDGDRKAYTEFFRKELPDIFKLVFSLAEDAPKPEALDDPDLFFSFSKDKDIRPLGTSLSDDPNDHFVFSAYGNLTVEQILTALGDKVPK